MINTDTIISETMKERRAMTAEEAIEYLKATEPSCEGYYHSSIELAIEALEKQIAKKPIEDEYCPICGASLELDGDYGYIHKLKYCQRCGQKIDWSDEYDE